MFIESQAYTWQYFTKTQILLKAELLFFAIFYKNPNTILAIFYKSPSTILINILSKSQILFWQYFIKKPNTILAIFYKSPILFDTWFRVTQIAIETQILVVDNQNH